MNPDKSRAFTSNRLTKTSCHIDLSVQVKFIGKHSHNKLYAETCMQAVNHAFSSVLCLLFLQMQEWKLPSLHAMHQCVHSNFYSVTPA